ncbi:MAG TPA: serine/threonine-protein kinase [Kofleriaceae bacterium]|nr:serine/threonine-protein kinase [Kofleriaceae bacterium]
MIGERVGEYAITDVLGHGAQGIVYAARHVSLGRDAAVKVFLPQFARDAARVRRFFDEARAIARLHHAGIVRIFEWGYDDRGRVYVAMERLRGETLYERLRRGPVALGEAVWIARELAAALRSAHEHVDDTGTPAPLAHRDIKPENIFLVDDAGGARVVIVDFGLARLAGAAEDAVTWSGAGTFGTPPYLSPEQLRGASDVDHRTDLYALGCVLYELVTGTPPFGFGTANELFAAHCDQPPPLLSEGALDIPGELDALAQRLVAKDRQQRPGSCADVIACLDALGLATPPREPVPGAPLRETIVPTSSAPGWRDRAWRRVLEVPPWAVAAAWFAAGTILLGASTVAGVGDSYLTQLNWSLNYVVLVPLVVSFMVKVVQRSDAAIRDMVVRGMIEPREDVAQVLRRFGRSMIGFVVALGAASIAISVGEWWQRPPIPGLWWTEAPVIGAAGAILQGLYTAALLGFVVYRLAWAQQLHAWTSPRSRLRLRIDRRTEDPRAGFEVLEEPLLFAMAANLMLQVTLYLSNAQHVGEVRGQSFFAVSDPFAEGASLFDVGTGRYPSGVPVIACVMVAGFALAALFVTRRAISAAGALESPPRHPPWPVARVGPGTMTCAFVVMVAGTVWFRLGPVAIAVVAALLVLRSLRARDTH